MRPDFPPAIDSTMIGNFRACGQKLNLEFLQHWKAAEPSVHLHAGAAFARGLEETRLAFYDRGKPPGEALALGMGALAKSYGDFECPSDSAKSAGRMLGALEFYFTTWPLGSDSAVPARIGDKLAVEFSFAEPLGIPHPQTGDPLLYVGRTDQVCNFAGGLWLEDDKTASQLGPSWGRQWDLRSQFTGYTWAGQQAGLPTQGVLVRGISILKTKYETAEHVTYRPKWQIDRWLKQVYRDIHRMIACWEDGYWDFNLDHACADFGGCPFRQVCQLQGRSAREWLDTYFVPRRWDPVTRTETPVAAPPYVE
jgi:hypothetical protein